MKYRKFEIISKLETGKDALGNPVMEDTVTGTFTGRFVPWTTEEISLLGRDVTAVSGKVITQAPASLVKTANRLKIDGIVYDIGKIPDLGRWRALYLKGWRV